jgi:pimeloyl-ACP methyl ester carboxylesterase
MRTTTRSRVSVSFTVVLKPVSPDGFNGLGVDEPPHPVACPIVRRIKNQDVEGTPVLLFHGYPDRATVWRHQIAALTAAGFRAIAPDLRGFGESGKPDEVSEYRVGRSVGDAVAILDALNIERAHVVGHDWGAGVAWATAMMAPERVDRLIVLSVGRPGTRPTLEERRNSWYYLYFQFAEAEELLRRDDYALAREFISTHPDLEDALETAASTPALNWYRANLHPRFELEPPRALPTVTAALGLWSTGDVYLSERQMTESPLAHYERIADAGHWMQLDAPDRVNELLLEHLC